MCTRMDLPPLPPLLEVLRDQAKEHGRVGGQEHSGKRPFQQELPTKRSARQEEARPHPGTKQSRHRRSVLGEG